VSYCSCVKSNEYYDRPDRLEHPELELTRNGDGTTPRQLLKNKRTTADLSMASEKSSRTGWLAGRGTCAHVPRPQNHTVVLRSANPAHQKPTPHSTMPSVVRRNEVTAHGTVPHSRAKPLLRSPRPPLDSGPRSMLAWTNHC
jgi:hypothetical protein